MMAIFFVINGEFTACENPGEDAGASLVEAVAPDAEPTT